MAGKRRHQAWQRVDEVIVDYCGDKMTFAEIKKKYNASHLTIWSITDSQGIPRREHQVTSDAGREVDRQNGRNNNKYPVNSNFFDNIDCEAKAYWWGFLYADGYVGKDARALVINLNDKDEKHLVKFRDLISPTRPIRKEIKFRKHLGIKTHTSILRVDDNHLCLRLQELGMIPKRPHFEYIKNNLSDDLFRHWVRGYFDGDGCASKSTPDIKVLGQEDLLQWIVYVLNDNNILHTKARPRRKGGPNGTKINIYELIIGGSHQMTSLRKYFYEDATIYLKRKKDIFDTYIIKR
jgi:DNA-binding transcriptional regulator WhiA